MAFMPGSRGVAVAMSGCSSSVPAASSTGRSLPPPPTVPVPSPTTSIAPTAEPSPSGISVLGADGSGAFGAGKYTTAFQPPFIFTLADRRADGKIDYESFGQVDVNQPGWIDISFGFDKPNRHGHGTWSADVFGLHRSAGRQPTITSG
jgi:hypothetical protein